MPAVSIFDSTAMVINPSWLSIPLHPLIGLADDDEAGPSFLHVDSNNDNVIRRIIRTEILPFVVRLDPVCKERIRVVYQFYLSKPDTRWDRVFDSNLLPFQRPTDVRKFFECIWDE